MNKSKVSPCPYCSKKKIEILYVTPDYLNDGMHVVCISCQSTGPIAYGDQESETCVKNEAIEEWNKRG